jgi:hypothetical protein
VFFEKAPHHIRYEKNFGVDQAKTLPRCLYAAKFITTCDPTGEYALRHYIQTGQLQEPTPTVRNCGGNCV